MQIQLDCKLDVMPSALVLAWQVTNHEPYEVGLFNRIKSVVPDGTHRFSADTAWVELDASGALLVEKRALPIPAGLGMAAYVPPNCSRLIAGGVYEETLRLPLPVPEMQPFKRALLLGPTPGEAVADMPARASRVVFRVGAFPVGGGVRLVAEHPAFPDVWSATPSAVARQEILVRSFDLLQPVTALAYRVAPWP
jgi:hypothetical protein